MQVFRNSFYNDFDSVGLIFLIYIFVVLGYSMLFLKLSYRLITKFIIIVVFIVIFIKFRFSFWRKGEVFIRLDCNLDQCFSFNYLT
jgi:hypothetical protein